MSRPSPNPAPAPRPRASLSCAGVAIRTQAQRRPCGWCRYTLCSCIHTCMHAAEAMRVAQAAIPNPNLKSALGPSSNLDLDHHYGSPCLTYHMLHSTSDPNPNQRPCAWRRQRGALPRMRTAQPRRCTSALRCGYTRWLHACTPACSRGPLVWTWYAGIARDHRMHAPNPDCHPSPRP